MVTCFDRDSPAGMEAGKFYPKIRITSEVLRLEADSRRKLVKGSVATL